MRSRPCSQKRRVTVRSATPLYAIGAGSGAGPHLRLTSSLPLSGLSTMPTEESPAVEAAAAADVATAPIEVEKNKEDKEKSRRKERRKKPRTPLREPSPVEEETKEENLGDKDTLGTTLSVQRSPKKKESERSKRRRDRRKAEKAIDAEGNDEAVESPASPLRDSREEEEGETKADEEDRAGGPSSSSSRCTYCSAKFGLLKQKRKCRMCESNCCSDCCSVRVSYPPPYTFKSPKSVCNDCLPKLFDLRSTMSNDSFPLSRSDNSGSSSGKGRRRKKSSSSKPSTPLSKSADGSDEKSTVQGDSAKETESKAATASGSTPSLVKKFVSSPMLRRRQRTTSAVFDGSFHTAGDKQVHTAFRMADPVCRLMFRFSGMYDGGTFDRSAIAKAAKLKTSIKYETVGSVERMFVPVPMLVKESEWTLSSSGEEPPEDDEEQWFDMPVFVFKPKGYDGEEPLPVVLWYHGGGFCIGSIEDMMYQSICRRICNMVRCIVVSVEYRLAPEFKFPHALEDCYR